jgi:hypothetical protein
MGKPQKGFFVFFLRFKLQKFCVLDDYQDKLIAGLCDFLGFGGIMVAIEHSIKRSSVIEVSRGLPTTQRAEATYKGHSFQQIEGSKRLFFDSGKELFKVVDGLKLLFTLKSDNKNAYYHLRLELQHFYGEGVFRVSWEILKQRDGIDLASKHLNGEGLLVKDYGRVHEVAQEIKKHYAAMEKVFHQVRNLNTPKTGEEYLQKVQDQLPVELCDKMREIKCLSNLSASEIEVLLAFVIWGKGLKINEKIVQLSDEHLIDPYRVPSLDLNFV